MKITAGACLTAAVVAMTVSPAVASSSSNGGVVVQAAGAPGPCSAAALRIMSAKKAFAWCKKYGDGLPRWLLPASKQRVRWKYVCKTAGVAMFFAPEIKGFIGLVGTFARRFEHLIRIPGAAEVLFC
jgi:hypothetical protein